LEDVVERHCGGEVRAEDAHSDEGLASFNASVAEVASRDTAMGHAVRTAAGKRLEEPEDEGIPDVSVMASGNLGLISFPREPGRVTLEEIAERRPGLLEALREHPGIAFLLVRSEQHGAVVLGPAGRRVLADDSVEGVDPLAPFGPFAADHVRRTDSFTHCPDIVVNGTFWEELEEVAAFEELVGSHGGMGGDQAHPFVLHPAHLPWPSEPVVGAANVHRVLRAWLSQLGQTAYDDPALQRGTEPGYSMVSEAPRESVSTRVDGASSAT
jgi:hypothetical protein